MQFALTVAIITGGEGTRAGGSKPSLMLAGDSLLGHSIKIAKQFSSNVILVSRGHRIDSRDDNIPVIFDDANLVGPLAGLTAALKYGVQEGFTHIFAMACDMPFLPNDLPAKLEQSLGQNHVAFAVYDGRLQPLASLWQVSALDYLPSYIASGKRSVIGFGEHVGLNTVEWPFATIDPFFNINDLNDLKQAEDMFMLHLRTK